MATGAPTKTQAARTQGRRLRTGAGVSVPVSWRPAIASISMSATTAPVSAATTCMVAILQTLSVKPKMPTVRR